MSNKKPSRGKFVKAKDFKGTMKKLILFLKPYYFKIALVVCFAILGTVFNILGPRILGEVTNELSIGLMAKVTHTGSINFNRIASIMLFLLGLYLLSALFSFIQGFIMTQVTEKISYTLRKSLASKINRLPLKYFDNTTHGEVLSIVTNDIDTMGSSLSQSITQMITSFVTVIGITIMMISISLEMTLMAFLVFPISMFFVLKVVKYSQKYYKQQQAYLAIVNGHVEEMYGGHLVIKAFNKEEDSIKLFNEHNETLYKSAWLSQFLSGLMHPITAFVGNIGYVGVCILGGYLTVNGSMTIGGIQSFIQYVRSFNQPISQMAQIMNLLQSTAAAAERVFAFLDQEELCEETKNPVPIQDEQGHSLINGSVTFDKVRFGYEEDQIIIHDFNFHVHAGQTVAIVGPTGAGKTTIVKLLMRFYELNSGSILIDGHDIVDFTREDLRHLFGMVLQDAWLFNGTIMDNLKYGKLDASDEEVIEAAKMANVHHYIQTLEQGYHTEINEESTNISQGQKQLLTIARAFLSNPKILILDEATSSVDTRTEVLIQEGMDKLMKGRTSFIIAHRLSTIKNADCIIVMNQGDIVELGSHDELLAKNGFYTSLYNSQFNNEQDPS